jgi:hypothetical protein
MPKRVEDDIKVERVLHSARIDKKLIRKLKQQGLDEELDDYLVLEKILREHFENKKK